MCFAKAIHVYDRMCICYILNFARSTLLRYRRVFEGVAGYTYNKLCATNAHGGRPRVSGAPLIVPRRSTLIATHEKTAVAGKEKEEIASLAVARRSTIMIIHHVLTVCGTRTQVGRRHFVR